MMNVAKGRVTKTVQKPGAKGTIYFLEIDGGAPEGYFISFFDDPKVPQGSVIQVDYKQNGNFQNGINDSIKVIEKAAEPGTTATPRGSFPKKSYTGNPNKDGTFDFRFNREDELNRQREIRYVGARKHAMEMASILLANDAAITSKQPKTRFRDIMALVDELTEKFFLATGGVDSPEKFPTDSGDIMDEVTQSYDESEEDSGGSMWDD